MDRVSPSRANRKGRKVLLLQRVAWFALELILENYSNAEKKLKREVVSDIAGEIDTTLSMIVADIKKAVSSFEDVVSDLAKSASKSALSSKTAAGVAAQVASSLTQVADAARELDAAMAEVALQTEHSRNVVAEAVGIAGDVSATMAVLDGASKSITKVLASITTIANQTNLLALNATIEASRAGEAGRGFAVVAQEVKNLAAQTTRATAQIGDQIKDLQCAMATSQASILRVGEIIDSIEVGSLSISSAVQQHNGATHEIAISSTELALNNREVGVLVGVLQEDATETDTLAVRVALMCTELAEKVKGSEMTIRSLLSRIEAAA